MTVCVGHETKAMLNNSGTRAKRSKLERDINVDIISQVILLFLLCFVGAVRKWACQSLYMCLRVSVDIVVHNS